MKQFPLLALILTLFPMMNKTTQATDEIIVYIGTYTGRDSEGIYVAKLNREDGTLSEPQLAAATDNPSFVALHSSKPLLYAINESGDSEGAVTAYAIDTSSGLLNKMNSQVAPGGSHCHLAVDPTGRVVVAANYGAGSICSFSLNDDGSLNEAASYIQHEGSSVNPQRQKGPHAHSANFSADSEHVVICDLGLDKILVYKVDTDTGELTPNDPPSTSVDGGSGPRHFAFHPNGKFAYANLEMSSEVRAFQYHAQHGVLYGFQTLSTLPEGFTAWNSTAETQVHPNGKFVYVSNRGHDSIAIFQVDQETGELTPIGHHPTHGQIPRNFGIDPSGEFLLAANQETDNVVVFRIDPDTGQLSETGSSIKVSMPVCVRFWEPR